MKNNSIIEEWNETTCDQNVNYWANMIENADQQQNFITVRLSELFIVILMGFNGNLLVFLLMRRPNLRKQSFSHYLSMLAVCDSISLLIRLLFWINLLSISMGKKILVTFHTSILCTLSEYIMTTNHVMCSWLLVCITSERIIVTSFPLSAIKMCTPRIAKTVVIILVFCVLSLFSYVLYYSTYSCGICGMASRIMTIHYTIATTFVTMLPLILIIVGNIIIVISMHRNSTLIIHQQRDDNRNHVTVMLVILSASFVVLFLPNAMLVLVMQLRSDWISDLQVALGPVNMLWDVNYGINFYLYAITGNMVRSELKAWYYRLCSNAKGVRKENHHPGLQLNSSVSSIEVSTLAA